MKKLIFLHVPLSICNLRCHYCYLSQRKECYQGVQPTMKYTPEQVAKALSKERIGGAAFINICAEGETLLLKDLDQYLKELLQEGHYIEVVTNMTVTPMLEKILRLDRELLNHLEFKCSFHYLELKNRGWLQIFADNVKKAWDAGASAMIEMVPNDELIPHIADVKQFSMANFGALPQLTIARNDGKNDIGYLTDLPMEEYDKIWSDFHSGFWEYKKTIFGVRQKEFCYAGLWSMHINLATGVYKQCLRSIPITDVFANPDKPLPKLPACSCHLAHCFNGHALLTMGLIPDATDVGYGDIRNRVRADGTEWLTPDLKNFFNGKLKDGNQCLTGFEKGCCRVKTFPLTFANKLLNKFWVLKRMKKQN